MGIEAGIMVPHPPLIIPAVGRGQERIVQATIDAYHEAARFLVAIKPETIIVISPHAPLYRDRFHVSSGRSAVGDFGQFRARSTRFRVDYDTDFTTALCERAQAEAFPAGATREREHRLDHGVMVPLWFIREAYAECTAREADGEATKDGMHERSLARDGSAACDSEVFPVPIVRLGLSGLSLEEHYRLGMLVQQTASDLGRRVVVVGSGDLSHKLTKDGPYGFDPSGPLYDDRVMDVMGRGAFGELLDFSESFCEQAAECGHRSFTIMAGCFDGVAVEPMCFTHESSTGVGYGICTFKALGPDVCRHFLEGTVAQEPSAGEGTFVGAVTETADVSTEASGASASAAGVSTEISAATPVETCAAPFEEVSTISEEDLACAPAVPTALDAHADEDAYVRLARATLTAFIRDAVVIDVPEGLPAECLTQRAGTFVSLHKEGKLRGCIGTLGPTTGSIAEEIIQNAISASTRDPRFDPVRPDEIDVLEITVDVLGEMEPIASFSALDPLRYGVVVTHGYKRGLLLPNLEGVETVEEQISIACQKAGIRSGETYALERFEVVRHH